MVDKGGGTTFASLEPRGSEDDRGYLWGLFSNRLRDNPKGEGWMARILVKIEGKVRPGIVDNL